MENWQYTNVEWLLHKASGRCLFPPGLRVRTGRVRCWVKRRSDARGHAPIGCRSFKRLREIRPPAHGCLLEVGLGCGAFANRQPRKIVQYMVSPSCVLMWGSVCCASCNCLHEGITRVGVKDASRCMCRFWVASKGRRRSGYSVCMRACFMG